MKSDPLPTAVETATGSEPIATPIAEAELEAAAEPASAPAKVPAAAAEPVEQQPGFGISLAEFERGIPIGDSWKVLSENEHDNGRVSLQLVSTTMRNVLLIVGGYPDDLTEVSVTFSATSDMTEGDTLSRFAVMVLMLAKHSDWTEDELGQFWQRLIKVGAGDETDFKIRKNDHVFWMTPLGVQGGTMFMTGVSVDAESDAPSLQRWLGDHPLPVGAGLYKHNERSGDASNGRYAFKGLRRKGDGSFIGELTNNANQDFQFATFKLSIYDGGGNLFDTAPIVITNFGAGQTRSFEAYIESVPAEYFYKIDFENGL